VRGKSSVEWVSISGNRRIGFAALAAVLLFVGAAVIWLDVQARDTGAIDMAIIGGTLAGGGMAAFIAITGKEQRKRRP